MTSAAHALQQAVFSALTSLPALTALLNGPRVFDDVPQPQAFPYVTFGQSSVRDFTTATEPGDEHIFTLHIWSRASGKREANAIADTVRAALHDQPLVLPEHHLINLRHEFTDTRRDPDGETIHATVRFRAVTEPH